jgi:aspartyl-tRNA(Asn)/glutamyl-tRNA(Gln) amidotransferase subunit A
MDYRSRVFGTEVQKRILLGTFILQSEYIYLFHNHSKYESYFLKAQQVRSLIAQDFANIFGGQKIDALITPVSASNIPPLLEQPLPSRNDDYLNDIMTVPASLANLPSLVIPFGPKKVGIQIIGASGLDFKILKLGKLMEDLNHYQ